MGGLVRRLASFGGELRRRKVLKVGGVYLVAAWVLIQVVATIFPVLLFPEWITRAVVVLVVLGFPVALTLAWALDWTEEGAIRAESDSPAGGSDVVGFWGRAILVGGVAALTAVVGWTAWTVWLASPGSAWGDRGNGGLDPSHVAVLYLDDFSPGRDLGYLADGLTEALIHELSQIEPLSVVSRNGVKPFRNLEIPLDSMARILGVGSVVEGSVERGANRLMATIQLIDGETGLHRLSRRIEATGDDPLALRDAIVSDAARLLSQHLGRDLELAEARTGTRSSEAWANLLKARARMQEADTLRWQLDQVEAARASLRDADGLLIRATELDPKWAEPWVARARIASALARLEGESQASFDQAVLEGGLDLANEALEVSPGLAAALAARGNLEFDLHWAADPLEAEDLLTRVEEDLRAAVAADPGNAEGWVGLAELLRTRGDFAEAALAAREALDADPFLIHSEKRILFTMAHAWLELEELERASEWVDEGRRRFPAEPSFAAAKLVILAGWPGVGLDVDTAQVLLRSVEQAYGIPAWPYGQLQVAAVLARAGLADSARAVVATVRDSRPDDPWAAYYAANVRVQLGEHEEAVALLERFLTQLPHRRSYIARDWWWRPLRDQPRFQRLVAAEGD